MAVYCAAGLSTVRDLARHHGHGSRLEPSKLARDPAKHLVVRFIAARRLLPGPAGCRPGVDVGAVVGIICIGFGALYGYSAWGAQRSHWCSSAHDLSLGLWLVEFH